MTPAQLNQLRALLARGLFFPAARELATTMLKVHARRLDAFPPAPPRQVEGVSPSPKATP